MWSTKSSIYLVNGKTDMRKGIDGLVSVMAEYGEMNLFDTEALFMFCGGRKDRYKVITWEKDGFMMSYKRIERGKLQWPKE